MTRTTCSGCGRPEKVCLCSHLQVRALPFELVIWQDPDEAKHPLSTAPLLHLSSPGSRLLVGDTFSFTDIFGDCPADDVALLYPLEGESLTVDLARPQIRKVLVLDGTWRKVRRLLLLNPWLHTLRHIALTPAESSRYLRVSPRDDGISTIEAVLMLADEWQPDVGYCEGIAVLDRMRELQMAMRRT